MVEPSPLAGSRMSRKFSSSSPGISGSMIVWVLGETIVGCNEPRWRTYSTVDINARSCPPSSALTEYPSLNSPGPQYCELMEHIPSKAHDFDSSFPNRELFPAKFISILAPSENAYNNLKSSQSVVQVPPALWFSSPSTTKSLSN